MVQGQFTKEVIKITLRVLIDLSETADTKELNEFADSMTEQMINLGNRIMGKQTGNRYSPNIIRLALAIWQRSKSAYDHIQKSNVFMFPSVRLLALRKKENTVHQGFNPKIYSRMHDEFVGKSGHKIVGHIMVDEMQLKSGIYFHSKGHEVTGFTTDGDGISLHGKLRNMLPLLEKNNETSLIKSTWKTKRKV